MVVAGAAVNDATVPVNADTLGGRPANDYVTDEEVVYYSGDIAIDETVPLNADTLQGYKASDFATTDWVKSAIANAQLGGGSGEGEIDLSGFALKTDVSAEIDNKISSIDYPVDSVNGKTGDVSLNAADIGARPDNWMPSADDVGAMPVFKASLADLSEDDVVEPGGYAITANNAGSVTGGAPELDGLARTLYVFNADRSNARVLQLECRAASSVNLANYTSDLFYRIITNSTPKVIQPWRRIGSAEEFAPAIRVITTAGENLNDYIQPGIYMWVSAEQGPTNAPTEPNTNVNGWLHVMSNGLETIKQIWYRLGHPDSNDHNTYVRTKTINSEWSSWKRYFTTADTIDIAHGGTGATTKEDALSNLGAIAKTGDTMTGNLTISNGSPTITFNETDNKSGDHVFNNSRHYLRAKASDTDFYEQFRTPAPSTELTATKSYDFLTTRDAVKITQGGTGATTAADALTNLGALPTAGGTMSGNLNMGNNNITYLADPTGNLQATNKQYVDKLLGTKADQEYVDKLLATKADEEYVDKGLATKANATPSITSMNNTYHYAHFVKIGKLVICTILPKITATNNLISSATITGIATAYRPSANKTFTFFSEQAKANGDTSGKATISIDTNGTMTFGATYQATVHEFSRTIFWMTA